MRSRRIRAIAWMLLGLVLLGAVGMGAVDLLLPGGAQAAPLPDLSLHKSVVNTLPPYHAGQEILYDLDVRNVGGPLPNPDAVVRVMDRLPPGVRFIGYNYQSTTLVTCSSNPNDPPDVTCTFPASALSFPAGVQIQLAVLLPTRLPGNGTITNQAEVNPQRTIPEANGSNNRSRVTIQVQP